MKVDNFDFFLMLLKFKKLKAFYWRCRVPNINSGISNNIPWNLKNGIKTINING